MYYPIITLKCKGDARKINLALSEYINLHISKSMKSHDLSHIDLKAVLQLLMERIKYRANLFAKTKDKIRERVALKDLINYFLQSQVSGYILDTNVMPDFIKKPIVACAGYAYLHPPGKYPDPNILFNPDPQNEPDKKSLARFANYLMALGIIYHHLSPQGWKLR